MTSNKFEVILFIFAVAFSSSTSNGNIRPVKKMLIDTDAGGDDAIAILMALQAEKLDNGPTVVGITCVNGNTYVDQVAVNVLKTLKVADRLDIPVYKGAAHPLLLTDTKDFHFGTDGFGDFDYPDPPSTELIKSTHAVTVMIDLVKQYPGEVTLLTLGPLTNVALAIRMYSSFLDDLQQLIIMGGSTDGTGLVKPGIEFNFFADPAANYIVFSSSTSNPAILLPFDSLIRKHISWKLRETVSQFNNTKIWLLDAVDSLDYSKEVGFWDCPDGIAAAIALTSGSIVTKSRLYYLETVYEGAQASGMIIVDYLNNTGNAANTNLIQGVNFMAFEQLVLRYFSD